jgi:hypothetical protein
MHATLLLSALALAAITADVSAADEPCKAADRREVTAVFTGRYADGVPIYRLPSVTVVGHRKTEIARIGREARPATRGGAVQSPRG